MPPPQSHIDIRLAGPDDAEVLSDMVRELAEFERLAEYNHCTPENLRAELAAPDGVLGAVLGSVDGVAAGMATFFTTYSTFAAKRGLYLEDLYVRQAYRHRGLGGQLLRYVARLARERDCGRMEWTTLLWNTDAIEFYEKLGATPNDAWTTYRLTDESLHRLAEAIASDGRAAS